jgi:sulfite oxidase
MTALPLNSVIGTAYKSTSDMLYVKGYALPGPTGNVAAVEVSVDDGQAWEKMKVTYQEGKYSWTIWEGEVLCTTETGTVYSRATDAVGNVQPKTGQWNIRGVAFNGWGKADW